VITKKGISVGIYEDEETAIKVEKLGLNPSKNLRKPLKTTIDAILTSQFFKQHIRS